MRKPSAFSTATARPDGPGPAGSRGPSSCAAISSMFCPGASTRSATSACGIPPGAPRRAACVTPCGSTATPDRRPVPNRRVPPLLSHRPSLVREHHRHRPGARAPGAEPASSSSSPDGPRCAQGLHSSRPLPRSRPKQASARPPQGAAADQRDPVPESALDHHARISLTRAIDRRKRPPGRLAHRPSTLFNPHTRRKNSLPQGEISMRGSAPHTRVPAPTRPFNPV